MSQNPIIQSEVEKFDEKASESFAKGGFLTTDLNGTWSLDMKSLKSFFRISLESLAISIYDRMLEEIGEDEKYSQEPMYDERDGFGLVNWYEEKKKIDLINQEKSRLRRVIEEERKKITS